MGNAVQECEELQKKTKVLQSELEKLQNELNAQTRTNSVSSPDSITSQEANQSIPFISTSWNHTIMSDKNRLGIDETGTKKVNNFAIVHIYMYSILQ